MKFLRAALVLVLICLFSGVLIAQEGFIALELEIPLDEDYTTAAVLTLPDTGAESYPTVILFHGSGPWDMDAAYSDAEGDSSNFRLIAESLASEGIAVLRFHKRGALGNGEYNMAEAQKTAFLSQIIADAEAVLAFAQAQETVGEIYLYGWSEGAWVAAHLAANQPEAIAAIIFQAPPNSPMAEIIEYQHLELGMSYLAENIDADQDGSLSLEEAATIPSTGSVGLMAAYYIFAQQSNPDEPSFSPYSDSNGDAVLALEGELRPSIERSLEMIRAYDDGINRVISEVLAESNLPILILHGDADGYVPLSEGEAVAEALPEQVDLLVYEGLGHALSPITVVAEDRFGVMSEQPILDLIAWLAGE